MSLPYSILSADNPFLFPAKHTCSSHSGFSRVTTNLSLTISLYLCSFLVPNWCNPAYSILINNIHNSNRKFQSYNFHNGNQLAPIILFYSRQLIEEYKQLAHVLEVINFANFKWNICTDYKAIYIIVGMYLGSQSRPCPYCIFHKTLDHHDKDYHYRRRTNWPHRTSYKKPASKCLHRLSCSGQVVSCKRH